MSKKIFLERSFAAVVKGQKEAHFDLEENSLSENSFDEHSLGDGEPGTSVITPAMRCFHYKDINNIAVKETHVNVRKKFRKRKVSKNVIIIDSSSSDDDLPDLFPVSERQRTTIDARNSNECLEYASASTSSQNEPILIDSDVDDVPPHGLYHDLLDLPVFLREKRGYPTIQAVHSIMNPPSELVSFSVPYDISSNASFLVSVKAIGHWKNVFCDGMGAWINNGSKTTFVKLRGSDILQTHEEYPSENVFKVIRRSYINKSEETLRKIIISVTDALGHILDIFSVQYLFTGVEKQVNIKPHGNAKGHRAYNRTKETIKNDIKLLSKTEKPSDVFSSILNKKGGLLALSGPGDIPRNTQQIYDLKRSKDKNMTDELKILMDKISNEQLLANNTYKFDLSTDPELILFIGNEEQLLDIEIYCTNPANFCILGIDPTFNIGNFMVTFTTYRHLKVKNKRNRNPVMMGPALIHQRKFENSYFELPCKMIKYNQNLCNILAFGTDGEHNLQKVFQLFLPNAAHLLCDIHMKDNIQSKLSKLQITKANASQYLHDIFGKDFETERQPGLVDAMSGEEFDKKLSNLKQRWIERHSNGLEFYLYFLEEKALMIKNHMTAEIRSLCGLGYPPIHYTQNANESLNSAFKNGLNKKLSLPDCVSRIQHYIKKQQEQINLAVISCGEFEVLPQYEHLKVPEERYYRMSENSKKASLKKFSEALVVPKSGKNPLTAISREICNNDKNLSVKIENCSVTKVPYEILEIVYRNAEKILKLDNSMVHSPGASRDQFIVASLSNPCLPHFVRIIQHIGNIVCDNQCIRWKTYKLCAHVLVVADSVPGLLKRFFDWHKSLKDPGTNLMAMSTHNLPKGRGKKATKATSIRKGPPNLKPRQPLSYIQEDQTHPPIPALPDPPPGSYIIFLLDFCNPNVAKCFGCQGNLKQTNKIPPPPANMIIVSKMKRTFFLRDRSERESKLSNVYFHFNEQCIKSKDLYFVSALLYCPDDLKPHLKASHKSRLQIIGIESDVV